VRIRARRGRTPRPVGPVRGRTRGIGSGRCGAARFASNQGLARIHADLAQRGAERSYGLDGGELTPSVNWSAYSLRKEWNAAKNLAEVASSPSRGARINVPAGNPGKSTPGGGDRYRPGRPHRTVWPTLRRTATAQGRSHTFPEREQSREGAG
jgi:hypothetical protein